MTNLIILSIVLLVFFSICNTIAHKYKLTNKSNLTVKDYFSTVINWLDIKTQLIEGETCSYLFSDFVRMPNIDLGITNCGKCVIWHELGHRAIHLKTNDWDIVALSIAQVCRILFMGLIIAMWIPFILNNIFFIKFLAYLAIVLQGIYFIVTIVNEFTASYWALINKNKIEKVNLKDIIFLTMFLMTYATSILFLFITYFNMNLLIYIIQHK